MLRTYWQSVASLSANDETLCPARVLGDNDFGAAFVKIGHDGVAVEGLCGDQHVEGQSLDERWHADRVEAMPRGRHTA